MSGHILFPLMLPLMRPILNRTDRVYVAIVYDKKLLLVKNWLARDTWRLPGGGRSKTESEIRAAAREIKEELHVVVAESRLEKIINTRAKTDGLKYAQTIYLYQIGIFPKILPDSYEIVAHDWFSQLPRDAAPGMVEVFTVLKSRGLL